MRLRIPLLVTGMLLGLSAPAFANQCPSDMQKFDQAMNAKMSASQASSDSMKQAMSLRAEAETLHKQGKHAESIEHLGRAMKLIGTTS